MHVLSYEILQMANEEAIFNVYLYLSHKTSPNDKETLRSVVFGLEHQFRHSKRRKWKERDVYRLHILKRAIESNPILADAKIGNLIRSKSGLTACSFEKPNGSISVAFKGTGDGEWIDNGEGLSGIPEENIYITYNADGTVSDKKIIPKDFATDQQVEALNWFHKIVAENGWSHKNIITLSGHSKGGNKAQFITMHSDLVTSCFSFNGQGFSPETLGSLERQYEGQYEERRWRIHSFASEQDYVHVLGEALVPEEQMYYFKSWAGIHPIDAILDEAGNFRPQTEQGALSATAAAFSQELMQLPPFIRQYATLGIMNIFQRYVGKGIPVNGDAVSAEQTITGIGVAVGSFLNRLRK